MQHYRAISNQILTTLWIPLCWDERFKQWKVKWDAHSHTSGQSQQKGTLWRAVLQPSVNQFYLFPQHLQSLLSTRKFVTQPRPWLRSKLSLFHALGSQTGTSSMAANHLSSGGPRAVELDWGTPNFPHTAPQNTFRGKRFQIITSPPSEVKVSSPTINFLK